jgi:molecular chaperone Hsp33
MNDELKQQYRERDRVVRAVAVDGSFRAAAIRTSATARQAQQRHKADPGGALILGRALTAAGLLASFLKGEERIIIDAAGDGIVKSVYAEALQVGEIVGYVRMNDAPQPNAPSAMGSGMLRVSRVLYNRAEPVTGIVEMVRGDITSDLGHYLTQSEQIPSVVMLDVEFDSEFSIVHAGGALIQALPGAAPEKIFAAYDNVDMLPRITSLFAQGQSPEDVLRLLVPSEIDVVSQTPVDFFCRCSIDRFKAMLLTLGYDEVAAMDAENQRELVCQKCAERYEISVADFAEMKATLLAQRN